MVDLIENGGSYECLGTESDSSDASTGVSYHREVICHGSVPPLQGYGLKVLVIKNCLIQVRRLQRKEQK